MSDQRPANEITEFRQWMEDRNAESIKQLGMPARLLNGGQSNYGSSKAAMEQWEQRVGKREAAQ